MVGRHRRRRRSPLLLLAVQAGAVHCFRFLRARSNGAASGAGDNGPSDCEWEAAGSCGMVSKPPECYSESEGLESCSIYVPRSQESPPDPDVPPEESSAASRGKGGGGRSSA